MTENVIIYGMLMLYKIMVLFAGIGFAYMGFKLFMADKVAAAGTIDAGSEKYKITLSGAAPGVFFSFFGAVLICISLIKGADYDISYFPQQEKLQIYIPDSPPLNE